MSAQAFTATVKSRRKLAGDYFELTFSVNGIEKFDFTPGQFVTVEIPVPKSEKPVMRAYSIASAPRGNEFDLCVLLVHGKSESGEHWTGQGSGYLHSLLVGDEIKFLGPSGVLKFEEPDKRDCLLLATGTGIAPLKAIAERLTEIECPRQIQLYFGLRYLNDIFYETEFHTLTKQNPNFSFRIGISRPPPEEISYAKGRLPAILSEDFGQGISKNTIAYICGGRTSSKGIKDKLVELGLDEECIHMEGYGA